MITITAGNASTPFTNWYDMKQTAFALNLCDELIAPDDWQDNKRARQEIQMAQSMGVKVTFPTIQATN